MPASSADDGGDDDDDDDNDALLGNDDPLARDRPREEDWRRVSECWVVAWRCVVAVVAVRRFEVRSDDGVKGVVSWVARRAMARERLVVFMVVSIACFCFVCVVALIQFLSSLFWPGSPC